MRNLPLHLEIDLCGRRLVVIHGGGKQINRFIFQSTPISVKQEEVEDLNCDGVIAGHCGLPFTQLFGDHLWHNTGALGMPANDGTCRTWYSILHPTDDGIMIEPLPLIYSAETASDKMRACASPAGMTMLCCPAYGRVPTYCRRGSVNRKAWRLTLGRSTGPDVKFQ